MGKSIDDIFGAYLLGDGLEQLESDLSELFRGEGIEISGLDPKAKKRVFFDKLDTHYKRKVLETGVDFFGSGRGGSVNWDLVDATRPAVFLKYLKAVARKGLVDRGVDRKTADYFIEAELGNLSYCFEVKQRFQEREKRDLAGVMEEEIKILYDIFRGEISQRRIQLHEIAVERARRKQEEASESKAQNDAVQSIRSDVDAVIAAAERTGQAGESAGRRGYVTKMWSLLRERCASSVGSMKSDYRSVMGELKKRMPERRERVKSAATQDTGPAGVESPQRHYVAEAARKGYSSAMSVWNEWGEKRQRRKAEKAARPPEPGKEPAYKSWAAYRWAFDPSYRTKRREERAAAGEAIERAVDRTGRPAEAREVVKEPFYKRKGTRYAALSTAGLALLLSGGALLYRGHEMSKSAERSQQPAAVEHQAARQNQAAAKGEAPQPQVTPRIMPTESALSSSIQWEWERDPSSWSILPMAKNSVRKGTDGNYRVETRVRVLEGNLIKFAQDDGVDYIGIKVGGSKKWLYFKPGEDVYIQLTESQMQKLRDGGLPYQIAGLSPNGKNKCTVKGSYRAKMFEGIPGAAQGNGGSASSSMKSSGSGEYAFMRTGGGPRLPGKYDRSYEPQSRHYMLDPDILASASNLNGPMARLYENPIFYKAGRNST